MNTGTKRVLKTLLKYMDEHYEWDFDTMNAEGAWKMIGEGCYRTAFLHIASNVVYKVGDLYANSDEAMNAERLGNEITDLPFAVRIPWIQHFGIPEFVGVSAIACEFAEDASPTECQSDFFLDWSTNQMHPCSCGRGDMCFSKCRKMISNATGITDAHAENVLFNDMTETFWLIDIAM